MRILGPPSTFFSSLHLLTAGAKKEPTERFAALEFDRCVRALEPSRIRLDLEAANSMCVGRPARDLLQLQIDQRCDGLSYRGSLQRTIPERSRQAGFHDYVAKFDRPGLIAGLKEPK